MPKTLLALTALLASTAALADTLVDNANGIQVDHAVVEGLCTGCQVGNVGAPGGVVRLRFHRGRL